MNSVVVHYQEIALKGRNRPWFIERLTENLRLATAGLGVRSVKPLMGRIELALGPGTSWEAISERLSTVFGVANYSIAGHTSSDLNELADAILEDLGDRAPQSFAVDARRSDKRYPVSSPEIERVLGGRIRGARGWPVDLSQPDLTIHVEVLKDRAFYYFGKQRGAGGLPTGVSGRVACLLSGGIDSPVAAYRMMRRGCRVQLIHFHAYPFVSMISQEKVREIVEVLTRYQLRSRLYLVPFGEVQRRVVLGVPAPLRIVIYRRFMLRIAARLAGREGARALVTGEVVGQVASQTLENMTVITTATAMPVFRPLIGMDKEEVTAEARRVGTYDISIIPDEDCCQLFSPRTVATRATAGSVEAAEASLALEELVELGASGARVEEFSFPVVQSSARS